MACKLNRLMILLSVWGGILLCCVNVTLFVLETFRAKDVYMQGSVEFHRDEASVYQTVTI